MDLNIIRRLIKLVEESNITEFSVEEGDLKIKISKEKEKFAVSQQAPLNYAVPSVPVSQTVSVASPATEQVKVDANLHEVKSPIVGTFYRSPSPDSAEFVKVGDKVAKGTVLCIVEAMKLMNEIESDVSGTIVNVLLNNGNPVEYNQPLFLIKAD